MSAQDDFENGEIDPNASEQVDDGVPPDEAISGERKPRVVNGDSLLLFGLLAAVGGATALMVLRAGAQPPAPSAEVVAADGAINAFLTNDAQNLKQTISMLPNTEKVIAQFNANPAPYQVPLNQLQVNPFETAGFQEQPTNSEDEQRRKLEEQDHAASTIAAGLKLESVVSGSHSMCMINGKPYRQGQSGDTFRVEQIGADGVWVRIGTQRFELKMTPPQIN